MVPKRKVKAFGQFFLINITSIYKFNRAIIFMKHPFFLKLTLSAISIPIIIIIFKPNFIDIFNKLEQVKYQQIPIVLSQLKTSQEAFKKDKSRYGTLDELVEDGLSLPSNNMIAFSCENISDSTYHLVATIVSEESGLTVGDRATIDQAGNRKADSSIRRVFPKLFQNNNH